MKNNLFLFLAASLLTAVLIPSMANAGNIKKSYINLAKDGNQATQADLGTLQSAYGSLFNIMKTTAYNQVQGTSSQHGVMYGTFTWLKDYLEVKNANIQVPGYKEIDIRRTYTLNLRFRVDKMNQGWPSLVYKGEEGYFPNYGDHRNYGVWLYDQNKTIYLCASSECLNTPIQYGQWHDFQGTVDKTNGVMKIYLDGVEKGRTTIPIEDMFSNNNSMYFGRGFDGAIEYLQLWNRVLTPNELQKVREKKINTLDPSLVGYWNFGVK